MFKVLTVNCRLDDGIAGNAHQPVPSTAQGRSQKSLHQFRHRFE